MAYHVNVTATYQPNDVCSDDVIHVTSSSSEVIQSTTFVQTSSPCWMGNSVSSPHTGLMTSITVIDDVTHVVTPLLTTTEGQIDTRPTTTGKVEQYTVQIKSEPILLINTEEIGKHVYF